MGVCFRARVMRCSSDGMFRTGCGAVQTCRRGCQYVACDGCLRGPGRVVVRCGRGLFPGRRGADVRCGRGCFRAGVGRMYVAEAAGMRASAVRCVKCRKSGLRRHGCGQGGDAGVRGSRPLGLFGLLRQPGDGRSLSVYTNRYGERAERGRRPETEASENGDVRNGRAETGRPRRVCARKRECAGWTGAKRLAACQYMFSYMDCDLSYFRSESDAALTPMLKLHER